MALLLLLPLLVSGYLACLKDPFSYYTLHRYEGQLLYLRVGYYGIMCFIAALAIVSAFSFVFSHDWFTYTLGPACLWGSWAGAHTFSTDFLAFFGKLISEAGLVDPKSSQAAVFALLAGLTTLVMPDVWAARTRRGLRAYLKSKDPERIESFLTKETLRHSPMGSTLVNAFAHKRSVMISMDDRKVYVGLIQSLGTPTEVTGVDLEIKLLPGLSGYRDKDSLKVTYTNTYPADTSILEPIYFKQENIISISLFSEKIREVFDEEEKAKKTIATELLP
ncbi:hypothetical protein [Pseudomonas argentinensis]|uniref:hypothetical protein n=1 Tax=Phytopseudomonas argentinensis TaxID=289370 RepID=UPI0008A9383C|nr:hypothetical protein [Pseudomonas argentinensis]